MEISSRRTVRRNSIPHTRSAKGRKPPGRRPLLLGDSRCSCQCALNGPMHGHGTSRRNSGGAMRKNASLTSRARFFRAAEKSTRNRRRSAHAIDMPFLRTVLGDIEADQVGVCYAHEHIIIDPSFTTYRYPDFLLDSVERACVDVMEFYAAGGRTLVDSMPCGGGRNPVKLA